MPNTTPEDIRSEATNELSEITLTNRTRFPVRYFAKRSPATRKLIERSDGTIEMRADNRWYSAYFEEPQLVSIIRVYHKNFSGNPNFNFAFQRHSDGAPIRVNKDSISHKKDDKERHYVEVRIFQFVNDISFEPPRRWVKGRAVTGIDVFGYDKENFENTVKNAFSIFSLKSETVAKFDDLVAAANTTIAKAASLKEDIESLELKKTELVDSLALQREELQSLNQSSSKVESDITVRSEVFNELANKINSSKTEVSAVTKEFELLIHKKTQAINELKGLQDQLDLFPAELSEFNQQGRDKSTRYMWLSAAPVGVIIAITLSLLFGAADLTTKYQEIPDIDLITLVASRLPFALIAIFILHISFQLTKILIREVFRINRQQLALSKLSIVAQEVTKSSREGLDLNDREVFDLKTKLKMTLLRSHLKTYLDDEFDFEVDSSIFKSMIRSFQKPDAKMGKETAGVVKHPIDKVADIAESAIKGDTVGD